MISEPILRSAQHKRYIGILFATTLGSALAMVGMAVVLWRTSEARSSARVAVVLFGVAGAVHYLATFVNLRRLRKMSSENLGPPLS